MPNHLKKLLLPVALVVLTSWYFANSYSVLISPGAGNIPNEKVFTVDGLTSQAGSSSTTDPDPRYRIYLFPGDGKFTFSNTPTNGQRFVYNYTYAGGSTTPFNPFTEATFEYGDDDLPPLRGISPPVALTAGSATGSIGPLNLGGSPLLITPVRKVVPGHKLTYIVTFENPSGSSCESLSGTLKFTFDDPILNYLGMDAYASSPGNYTEAPYVPNSGIVEWTFSNVPRGTGHQRNVFLQFQTESAVAAGTPINPPRVEFERATVEACGITSVYTLNDHSVVSSSHDPNQKTVTPAEFCANDQGYLEFMVTFQNDGHGPVEDIHIRDELDTLFANSCLNLTDIQLIDYAPAPKTLNQGFAGRTYSIDLLGVDMPGTGQTGYGKDFGEHETKGYVRFRVPMSCLSERPPCSAVCNRASIIFDCNPPLETNLALSRIKCENPPVSCDTCSETVDTLSAWTDPAVGDSLLLPNASGGGSPLPGVSLNDYTDFKWYPASGVSNARILHPALQDDRTQTYTLVASGPCKRLILHLPVVRTCGLTMNVAQTMTMSNCDPVYSLTFTTNATAVGFDPAALEWNDCDPHGATWTKTYPPGQYYFSVKDPVTGCYAEQWVDLPAGPFSVSDDPNDCQGKPVVAGGSGQYTYAWSWYPGGSSTPVTSTQGPPLNLSGKDYVQVTVTDQQTQCTATLSLQKNCKSPWTGGGWPWVGVLFALTALVFGWLRLRKTR